MSSISQCYQEIARYNNLKAKVSSISSSLSPVISYTSNLEINIKNKYSVDDDATPIVGKVSKLRNDIQNTQNYLSSNIISAIDDEISKLYETIRRLEEEERRRIAAEEESRRRAEEESRRIAAMSMRRNY